MATSTGLRTRGGPPVSAGTSSGRLAGLPRTVGCVFVWTSGIHVGIVAADTDFYRSSADRALPVIRAAWSDVFMASPVAWGLAVALGELLIGLATLRGGRWTVLGLTAAVGFHSCLLLFGWGFWLWSVPVLAVLVPATVREARRGS